MSDLLGWARSQGCTVVRFPPSLDHSAPAQILTAPPGAMRQSSPALLPAQSAVLHTVVPMQTSVPSETQSTLKGLHMSSCRQLPAQIVPRSLCKSRLVVQEKVGQIPELIQQCLKQLPDASQATLGWPLAGHITDRAEGTYRNRINPTTTRPATRFIGPPRMPGRPGERRFLAGTLNTSKRAFPRWPPFGAPGQYVQPHINSR